jgi:hypothetical protein
MIPVIDAIAATPMLRDPEAACADKNPVVTTLWNDFAKAGRPYRNG